MHSFNATSQTKVSLYIIFILLNFKYIEANNVY